MAKSPCATEVANDLHGDVINLARVIQHPTLGPQLYRRLRRVWFGTEEFQDAATLLRLEPMREIPDPSRAYRYFISSWMGLNGVAGTVHRKNSLARRFSSSGGDPGRRWTSAVMSIPEWRRRLAGVQILSSCGIELCERIADDPDTVIYGDPPYFIKGARYLHDFAQDDHRRLSDALRRFRKTRVILSYYDHLLLEELYPGWRRVTIEAKKGLGNSRRPEGNEATTAPEILLLNFPASPSP